jgi:hypothetical protein
MGRPRLAACTCKPTRACTCTPDIDTHKALTPPMHAHARPNFTRHRGRKIALHVRAHDLDALAAACPGLRELSLHIPDFHGWPAAAVLPHVTLLKMPGARLGPGSRAPDLPKLAPWLQALAWECAGQHSRWRWPEMEDARRMAAALHAHKALTSLDIAAPLGEELNGWISHAARLPALSSLRCTLRSDNHGYAHLPADAHGIICVAARLAECKALTSLKFGVVVNMTTENTMPIGRVLAAVAAAAPGRLRELELGGCALPEGAAEHASLAAPTLAALPLMPGLERLTLRFPEAQALNDAVLSAIVAPLAGARQHCRSPSELRLALHKAHLEEWGGEVTAACRARLCAANPGLSFEV